jgi:hypothetical protein
VAEILSVALAGRLPDRTIKRKGACTLSGPIVRRYGFPNFDKIFGERPLQHGVDDTESSAKPPEKAKSGESKQKAPAKPKSAKPKKS